MKNKRPAPSSPDGGQPPRPARRFGALSVIMSLALPALFLLALLLPHNALRWAFLIITALSLAAMWLLRAFVKNARGTLTVVYGALAVVIGLALYMNGQSPEARGVSSSRADQGSLFTNPDAGALGALLNSSATPEPTSAVTTTTISAAQQQLENFLNYWALQNVPEMLKLCTPSWVAQQQSPETELFQLIRLSRPLQYQIENVQGSEGDTSRTITLKVTIDENNGFDPVVKRMQVLMFRVNDVWYVDPQSLGGTTVDEAAESALSGQPMVASTIAPTATPSPAADGTSDVKVYYNADGGKYYHAIPNCSDVAERYWPLTEFSYSDLNSQQFKNLLRCTTCNAPQRPATQ